MLSEAKHDKQKVGVILTVNALSNLSNNDFILFLNYNGRKNHGRINNVRRAVHSLAGSGEGGRGHQ